MKIEIYNLSLPQMQQYTRIFINQSKGTKSKPQILFQIMKKARRDLLLSTFAHLLTYSLDIATPTSPFCF